MRKFAWSAAMGCVLAYTATAADVQPRPIAEPVPAFTTETSCRSALALALDPACAAPGNPDELMSSELGALPDSGRDFQGIAAEAGALQQTMLPDASTSHRLIPALLCLGGLVVLLRKRPT